MDKNEREILKEILEALMKAADKADEKDPEEQGEEPTATAPVSDNFKEKFATLHENVVELKERTEKLQRAAVRLNKYNNELWEEVARHLEVTRETHLIKYEPEESRFKVWKKKGVSASKGKAKRFILDDED
jgi:predicted RNase H-like nuclease (RuvC/YqgF family)